MNRRFLPASRSIALLFSIGVATGCGLSTDADSSDSPERDPVRAVGAPTPVVAHGASGPSRSAGSPDLHAENASDLALLFMGVSRDDGYRLDLRVQHIPSQAVYAIAVYARTPGKDCVEGGGVRVTPRYKTSAWVTARTSASCGLSIDAVGPNRFAGSFDGELVPEGAATMTPIHVKLRFDAENSRLVGSLSPSSQSSQ